MRQHTLKRNQTQAMAPAPRSTIEKHGIHAQKGERGACVEPKGVRNKMPGEGSRERNTSETEWP